MPGDFVFALLAVIFLFMLEGLPLVFSELGAVLSPNALKIASCLFEIVSVSSL